MKSMHVCTDLVRLYTGRPRTNNIDCFLHNGVGFFRRYWTQMTIYPQLFPHLLTYYDHNFAQEKRWNKMHLLIKSPIHLDSLTCSCPTMHYVSISYGISTNTGLKRHDVLDMCPNVNPRRQNSLCTQNVEMKFTFKAFQVSTFKSNIDIVWVSIFLYLAWKITTFTNQATQRQSNKLKTQNGWHTIYWRSPLKTAPTSLSTGKMVNRIV